MAILGTLAIFITHRQGDENSHLYLHGRPHPVETTDLEMRPDLEKLNRFRKGIWNVLRQIASFPRLILVLLGGVAFAIYAPLLATGEPTDLIRRSGGLLRACGIIIAVVGLRRIKDHFGIPTAGDELSA